MPEGHVLHRLARRYSSAFSGDVVTVSSPQGRFASEAARVDATELVVAEAFGKHLFVSFANELSVHVHLGLYGKATIAKGAAPEPVGLVRMRIEGSRHYADLRGPSACEVLTDEGVQAVVSRLGPDPIRRDADPDRAWARVQASRMPIGALLMSQDAFAGVGNIYRAEVLFRQRMSPYREARALRRPAFDALWSDLVLLMRLGVRSGRIDTVLPEHEPDAMGRPAREDRHGGEVYVYGRAGQQCIVCRTRVRQEQMQGRTLYWCARCQRR